MKDEVYLKKLGRKIAALRKDKGISFRQMAEILNTSTSQIMRIEAGEVNTSILNLKRIAEEFDLNISELTNTD